MVASIQGSSARLAAIVLSALGLAAAARVVFTVPGSPVPQSAQTLVVVLAGLVLGPTLGSLGMLLYLLMGVLGLPVFADGGAGVQVLVGPTGGFLVGFVAAAAVAGGVGGELRQARWWRLVAAAMLAHGVILLLGWAWLARSLGPSSAFEHGVAPFLLGGLAKSLAAASLAWWRLRR